ncbi:ABC-type dipeptide/oligopeptide/nickel transport system permease component [Gaiella occulta]|uniref:ABC-type dipeptide/oligopeptide/nickel transport system permease component n=1 Tax=Gaiella occulta TaxID=1002870 RepID=A0A7M2Z148_9ACTN|nr:ABC transporter permease [Gaiella occulta]RDI75382.1 ABC-type dipeptide/oligopeptide/nickel transport system permease component [Gaiella occulta]
MKTDAQAKQLAGAGADGGSIVADGLPAAAVEIRARGYWEQVWRRFRQDRVAIAGGVFIVALVVAAFVGGPIAARVLGHGPNEIFANGLDVTTEQPVGPFTTISTAPFPTAPGTKGFADTFLVLGADGQLGRDMFLRILYGAQTSLEVAVLATLLSVSLGVFLGLLAGYFRGAVDTVISRLTEIAMAFPVLLFIIAVAATVGERLNKITFGFLAPGVFTLTVIFALFGWFYPARIIRGQVLSLREKEFIEAARMTGAGDWRIMRSHLLPHLVAPIIVYSTLIVASNIVAEAGLSFLGLGIQAPTASWGNLLSAGPTYYLTQPWLMVWPGLMILLTTLAFNLLGDGLRDAFDPRHTV